MRIRYVICDVFTRRRFGGNQLAVVTDAQGLDDKTMQAIAREFNFSESSFVFPPEQGLTRRVRIFTPTAEVPFAGHPNIGTAFALAHDGAFGPLHQDLEVVFEEAAGPVPISIRKERDGQLFCELEAPQALTLGARLTAAHAAEILSLERADIATDAHPPLLASVGLPFVVVQLRDRDALARAAVNHAALPSLTALGLPTDLHVYCLADDDHDIRARMFAPGDGLPEDPATGSANCALAALRAGLSPDGETEKRWRIAQGVEMGRPSELFARTERTADGRCRSWIGGHCVRVGEGWIEVG